MSFVILAWNCKKFFIILSPGHLGEDGSIQENNRKVGKITNVNSDFMMVNSLENAKWCWRCCQLIWLSIPFNVNSHVNPSNAIKARKREVDLGAAAEGPWGEVGGARPDLPSTGDLKLQLPSKKKIGHFPHMFLSPDIEESCFRWARRTARFDSFWKRSRKVGSCGGCIIMVEHHSRNVEMKPTLHSFVWVLGDAKFSGAGKQKYEQLVEIKLSLEMEIQTYRSILEDEEKRIRRSYLLFCLLLTSLGAVDMKMKTVRAMAFGVQDMKVDWTEFLTRTVMFCTLRWFLFF